ncbi:TetR/AcrR family transcriptional regulator [Noviherbaspirillum malthae]|jgi:AcrR family transcriptional regulator|uniref:TetR/AcrR family transcriptional regulator n=1 Tax=Noviherbaspirillum malthae TaxID=1260987 RepID=UPI00188DF128|nr:TetR/AcrR family transcriptional regulator [Noviherbaspirillum malthae]
MKNLASLTDRKNDLTRQLILDAAIEMVEAAPVHELTVRAAAKQANISERTVFRYFSSRDDLLDAVAEEMHRKLNLPSPPSTLDELLVAPRQLFSAFDKKTALTKAALHPEIVDRIRESQGSRTGIAIEDIIDGLAPESGVQERRFAVATIRYYLTASTWYYYRFSFGFTLEESIVGAEMAIRQAINNIAQ